MSVADPTQWPLVLCGPMLRRVEPQEVSVFVALKFARKIKLSIYKYAANTTVSTFIQREEVDTLPLGKHLHAKVVTILFDTPLVPGETYAYDLEFTRLSSPDPLDTGPEVRNLAQLQLLAGAFPLGYALDRLPSFALPPADLNSLRIIHASCRKPHGEQLDALPVLDTLVENSYLKPLERPHQLFLTGDQIYADDVAPLLLALVTAAGDALLGWPVDELLPLEAGPTKALDLKPNSRAAIAKEAKFTSAEAGSHLLSLGEFFAMYIFVWSPSIWPSSLPSFSDLFPKEAATILSGYDIDKEYYSAKALQTTFNIQQGALAKFRNSLPAVRRALANVPNYMMCDDHEVTDDWNITGSWQTDVYGTELGRRIVGNALSAYAVFQAWGNEPTGEFAPTAKGGALLASLSKFQAGDGSDYNEQSTTYLAIRDAMRIPPTVASPGVRWDYSIDYASHKVIVLDTRTHREFLHPSSSNQGNLLGPSEIYRQVTARLNPPRPVTLLVSPPPFTGHPFVERVVQHAPDLTRGTILRYAYPYLDAKTGPATDREGWWVRGAPVAFETLLEKLVPFQRVVILSGDVHYGFTVEIRYWNERSSANETAAYVQLVSSSLKNEGNLTRGVGGIGWPSRVIPQPPDSVSLIGWSLPGYHLKDGLTARFVNGKPAVQDTPCGSEMTDKPEWRYRLLFITDARTSTNRGITLTVPPSVPSNYAERKRALAWEQRELAKNDQMRTVVGNNHLAEVTFAVTQPNYAVFHNFWFKLDPTGARLPHTIHYARLTPPDLSEPPPTPQSPG